MLLRSPSLVAALVFEPSSIRDRQKNVAKVIFSWSQDRLRTQPAISAQPQQHNIRPDHSPAASVLSRYGPLLLHVLRYIRLTTIRYASQR